MNNFKQIIKRISINITGARNPDQLKNLLKRIIEKKCYPKYTTQDMINTLIELGVKEGDTVFVHSSWDNFFNYNGTPVELIKDLLNLIGNQGTLGMPAYPPEINPNTIFNVKRTPSGAGFLTELFRRYPGVKRSINLDHSVCAIGAKAAYLTQDHHKSLTSWDENSPYYRLKEVDALILGFGVGKNLEVATSLHCADSILRDKIYFFSQLFPHKITYKYKDYNGKIEEHTFLKSIGKLNTKKIAKHMDRNKLKEVKLSNLDIYYIEARYLIDRIIELGQKGITMYVKPKPKKNLFYKI